MIGWHWHQLDHMQIICTSLQTDNHASTSPLGFHRPDALSAAQPTVSKHHKHYRELSLLLLLLLMLLVSGIAAAVWFQYQRVRHRISRLSASARRAFAFSGTRRRGSTAMERSSCMRFCTTSSGRQPSTGPRTPPTTSSWSRASRRPRTTTS